MTFCRDFVNSIKNIPTYLDHFEEHEKSFYFEKRIVQAFAIILEVPLFTVDDNPSDEPIYIQWFGRHSPKTRAVNGRPDAFANCMTYYCAIDITRSTGNTQWRQECVPVTTHFKEYLRIRGLSLDDTFLIFIPQELSEETYDFIYKTSDIRYVPIELPTFVKIFETASFPYTLLHVDFKALLVKIARCVKKCNTLESFRTCVNELIAPWQKEVLTAELHAFIGIKVREIISTGRHTFGMSELMVSLNADREVLDFFRLLDIQLTQGIVSDIIVSSGFARRAGYILKTDEEFYEFVPRHDFIRRYEKVMRKMAGI